METGFIGKLVSYRKKKQATGLTSIRNLSIRMQAGDLFGALVKHKINHASSLYNSADLFSLSLPLLLEEAPEIFLATNRNNKSNFTSSDEKQCPVVEVKHKLHNSAKVQYFSMSSADDFSRSVYNQSQICIGESKLAFNILMSLKGISSSIFKLDCLPSRFYVLGRSTNAVYNLVMEVRSLFVLRSLLDAAISAFVMQTQSMAHSALGSALFKMLHIIDESLSSLSCGDFEGANLWKKENKVSCLVLWEKIKLHRVCLIQLYSFICPAELIHHDLHSFGKLIYQTINHTGYQSNTTTIQDVISKYLYCPEQWILSNDTNCNQLGNWVVLQRLLAKFSSARSSTIADDINSSGCNIHNTSSSNIVVHSRCFHSNYPPLFRNAHLLKIRSNTSNKVMQGNIEILIIIFCY